MFSQNIFKVRVNFAFFHTVDYYYTSFITCMNGRQGFYSSTHLPWDSWLMIRSCKCCWGHTVWNYGKILSHIFDKNFVKATFPYSFCKIVDLTKYLLFRLEKIYYFYTLWDQKATTATIYQKCTTSQFGPFTEKWGFSWEI